VKCPQRGKKKITVQTRQSDTYRTPWNSGGLSKQTRNRTLKVPDRRNNPLRPSKSKPPLAGTERNPILPRTNSSRGIANSESDSPRIAARQLGARIAPARRGTSRRRGSGGEVEKLPPLRAIANGLSFALGEED
jgi:hypothetical protein